MRPDIPAQAERAVRIAALDSARVPRGGPAARAAHRDPARPGRGDPDTIASGPRARGRDAWPRRVRRSADAAAVGRRPGRTAHGSASSRASDPTSCRTSCPRPPSRAPAGSLSAGRCTRTATRPGCSTRRCRSRRVCARSPRSAPHRSPRRLLPASENGNGPAGTGPLAIRGACGLATPAAREAPAARAARPAGRASRPRSAGRARGSGAAPWRSRRACAGRGRRGRSAS